MRRYNLFYYSVSTDWCSSACFELSSNEAVSVYALLSDVIKRIVIPRPTTACPNQQSLVLWSWVLCWWARSYASFSIGELIEAQFQPWTLQNLFVSWICVRTVSCIAIAWYRMLSLSAEVDAIDISTDALQVAGNQNVQDHGMEQPSVPNPFRSFRDLSKKNTTWSYPNPPYVDEKIWTACQMEFTFTDRTWPSNQVQTDWNWFAVFLCATRLPNWWWVFWSVKLGNSMDFIWWISTQNHSLGLSSQTVVTVYSAWL